MFLVEGLLFAIRAETGDTATDKDLGFIDRITKIRARVTQNNQMPRLGHERGHVSHVAADDDVDTLHGNPGTGRRGPLHHDQTPVAGGRQGLAGVPLHPDQPGHDILGAPGTGVASDRDAGMFVHAGAVVTDMPVDMDLDRRIQTTRQRVFTPRMEHMKDPLIRRLQRCIHLSHAQVRQVEFDPLRCHAA